MDTDAYPQLTRTENKPQAEDMERIKLAEKFEGVRHRFSALIRSINGILGQNWY